MTITLIFLTASSHPSTGYSYFFGWKYFVTVCMGPIIWWLQTVLAALVSQARERLMQPGWSRAGCRGEHLARMGLTVWGQQIKQVKHTHYKLWWVLWRTQTNCYGRAFWVISFTEGGLRRPLWRGGTQAESSKGQRQPYKGVLCGCRHQKRNCLRVDFLREGANEGGPRLWDKGLEPWVCLQVCFLHSHILMNALQTWGRVVTASSPACPDSRASSAEREWLFCSLGKPPSWGLVEMGC